MDTGPVEPGASTVPPSSHAPALEPATGVAGSTIPGSPGAGRAWPDPPPPPPPPPPAGPTAPAPYVYPAELAGWPQPGGGPGASRPGHGRLPWIVALLLSLGLVWGMAALAVLVSSLAGRPAPVACDVGDGWSCRRLEVPALHDAPDGAKVPVTYAIHPATGRGNAARRVLVYAVGGPGSSGLGDARWLSSSLDPRVAEAFDIVVYDPRGTGDSDPRACERAAGAWEASARDATAVTRFVADCFAEARVPEADAARYASREVAGDIEAIRQALDVSRIAIYGSSYGTVVGQAYAAAYPERLEALVLDAPVDPTLAGAETWLHAGRAFDTSLAATLAACTGDQDCARAMPDPAATYGSLRDRLQRIGSFTTSVTDSSGRPRDVVIDRVAFDDLVELAMYSTSDRARFLRALAAYARADARPLARLVDAWDLPASPPDFTYYATWCADVTAPADLRDYRAVAAGDSSLSTIATRTADMLAPCTAWPVHPPEPAPPARSPLLPREVPTLVIGATGDTITTMADARAIATRIAGARVVEVRGGDHGSLGRACPQKLVGDLLVDGRLPDLSATTCTDTIADDVLPLTSRTLDGPDEAVTSIVWEAASAPELDRWDGEGTRTIGCTDGGTMSFSGSGSSWRADVALHDCAWADGVALSGDGWIDLDSLDASLHVTGERGTLDLRWEGSSWRLAGTWDGRQVDERD